MGWNASFRHRQATPSSTARGSVPKPRNTLFRKLKSLARRTAHQPEPPKAPCVPNVPNPAVASGLTKPLEAAPRAPLVVQVEARFPGSIVLPEPCIYTHEYSSTQSLVPSERLCRGLLRHIDHCSRELITRKDVKALLPQRRRGQLSSTKPLRYELRFRIIRRDGSVWADQVFSSYQKQDVTRTNTGDVILAVHRIIGLFLCRHDPSFTWAELPTGVPSSLFKPQSSGSELSHTVVGNPLPLSCVPEARFLDASQSFEAIPGYTIHFSFRSHCRSRSEIEWKREITLHSLQPAPLNLPLAEDLIWRSFDSVNNAVEGRRAAFFQENAAQDLRDGVNSFSFDEDALDIELRISNNLGPDYDHLTRTVRSKLGLFQHPDARDCQDFVQSVQNSLMRFRDFADGQIGALADFDLRVLTLHGLGWYIDSPARFVLGSMMTHSRDTIEALLERIQTGIAYALRGSDATIHVVAHKRGHLVLDEVMVIRSHQARTLPPASYTVDDQMKDTVARLKRRIQQDLDAICKDTCSIDDIPEDPTDAVAPGSAQAASPLSKEDDSSKEAAHVEFTVSAPSEGGSEPNSPRVVELPDGLVFDGVNAARTSSMSSTRRRAFPLIPEKFSLPSSKTTSIVTATTPRQSFEVSQIDVDTEATSEPESSYKEIPHPKTEVLPDLGPLDTRHKPEEKTVDEPTCAVQSQAELEAAKLPAPETSVLSPEPEPVVVAQLLSTTVQPVTDWLPIWEESSIVEPELSAQVHQSREPVTAGEIDVVEEAKSDNDDGALTVPVEESKQVEALGRDTGPVAFLVSGGVPEDSNAGLESHIESEPMDWLQSNLALSAPQDDVSIAQVEEIRPESPTLPEQLGLAEPEAKKSVTPGEPDMSPVVEVAVEPFAERSVESTLEPVDASVAEPTVAELSFDENVDGLATCCSSVLGEVIHREEDHDEKLVSEEGLFMGPSTRAVVDMHVEPATNEESAILERSAVPEELVGYDGTDTCGELVVIRLPVYEDHRHEPTTDEKPEIKESQIEEFLTVEPDVQKPAETTRETSVEPVVEPAVEPVVDPVVEEVVDLVAELADDAAAEPAVHLVDEATSPTAEAAVDLTVEPSVDATTLATNVSSEPRPALEEAAVLSRISIQDEPVGASAVSTTEESDNSRPSTPSTPSLSSGAGNSRRPSLLETPNMIRTLSDVRTAVVFGSDSGSDIGGRHGGNTDGEPDVGYPSFVQDKSGSVRRLLDYARLTMPIPVRCEELPEAASTPTEVPQDDHAALALRDEICDTEVSEAAEIIIADSADKLDDPKLVSFDSAPRTLFEEEFSRTKRDLDLDLDDNDEDSLKDENEFGDASFADEEPNSVTPTQTEAEQQPEGSSTEDVPGALESDVFSATLEHGQMSDADTVPELAEPEQVPDPTQEASKMESLGQYLDNSQETVLETQQAKDEALPDNDQELGQMQEPEPTTPGMVNDTSLEAEQGAEGDGPDVNPETESESPQDDVAVAVVVGDAESEVEDIGQESVLPVVLARTSAEHLVLDTSMPLTKVSSEASSWEDVETEGASSSKHTDADYGARDSIDSIEDDVDEVEELTVVGQRRMVSMPTAGFFGLNESKLVEVGIRGALTGSHAFDRAAGRVSGLHEKTARPQTPSQPERTASVPTTPVKEGVPLPGKTAPRSPGKVFHRRTKSGSYKAAFVPAKMAKRAGTPSEVKMPVKLITTRSPTPPKAAGETGTAPGSPPSGDATAKHDTYVPRVVMMLAGVTTLIGKTAS